MKRKFIYFIDGGYSTRLYPDSTLAMFVTDVYGDVYINKKDYWELKK